MQTIATFAPRFGVSMLAAIALGILFTGNLAYADTTHPSDQTNSGDHGTWNHEGGDQDGHDHGDVDHEHVGLTGDWYRWHEVSGVRQSYFDWVSYCQWFDATYGYVTPECAPYLY